MIESGLWVERFGSFLNILTFYPLCRRGGGEGGGGGIERF